MGSDTEIELTLVGAGSPHMSAERYGSAVAIRSDGHLLLTDCGPATTYKLLRSGLNPLEVEALLVSHHHFDHTADVANLLLGHWEKSLGNYEPIHVVGPQPTARFVDTLVGENGAYRPDIDARRNSPVSQNLWVNRGGTLPRPQLTQRVDELAEGDSITLDSGWQVTTTRAEHVQPFLDSLAYRIEIGNRSIVITGDTEPCESVTQLAEGADLMVAMCCELDSERGIVPGQMGTDGVGEMAAKAGVKRLVLTHTNTKLAEPGRRERAVHAVAQHFDGEIYFGFEGLTLTI